MEQIPIYNLTFNICLSYILLGYKPPQTQGLNQQWLIVSHYSVGWPDSPDHSQEIQKLEKEKLGSSVSWATSCLCDFGQVIEPHIPHL